ncbi:MAG: hypothetical protein R2909_14170 [Gemmatimonadales bacterium]
MPSSLTNPGRLSLKPHALLLTALLLPAASALPAQDRERPNELTLAVETAAGGARYLRTLGTGVDLGIELTLGPAYSVHLAGPKGDLREWGEAYPVLRLRPTESLALLLSPIGIGAIIGDDFGTVYPSGQAGVELALGRLRLASLVRTVRIAGGNGTGEYRTTWVPLRAALAFPW